MDLTTWISTNLGRGASASNPINPYPPNSIYGQCVTASSSWSLAQGGSQLLGTTAYDIWLAGNSFFNKIENTPTNQPSPGDIVFYAPNTASIGTGSAGHTDIAVDQITANSFQGVDMDWNGDGNLQYVTHNYDGVLGWFTPANQGGDNMESLTSQNDVNNLYAELLGRNPNPGEGGNWIGIPWPTAYYGIAQTPEGVAFTEQVRKWQAGNAPAPAPTVLVPGIYIVQ